MRSWKDKLPDYEFILWDLNRFDINESLWVKQAVEAKKYAFAADYIRLYALYHYGGIYLDTDVEVLKSFNPLLDNDYILGYEELDLIGVGTLGSVKHSMWSRICLAYYDNRAFIVDKGMYDKKILPCIISTIFRENNLNLHIYPSDYFTANSYLTGKITCTPNTYCIHHFAGSWLSLYEKLRIKAFRMIGRGKVYNILRHIKRFLIR